MKPHAVVGVCVGSVGVLQASLHPGDEAVMAWESGIAALEGFHSVVYRRGRGSEWPVLDLYSLRTKVAKELGL